MATDEFDVRKFHSQMQSLSRVVIDRSSKVSTEEATKMSLVCPFFQTLGYNIYDPEEFVPEFTADIGVKKGEKVDYAILQSGVPVMIIEAKPVGTDLSFHISQLYRYFNAVPARVAVLTNGVEYRFYTDLENINKMDEKPFLQISMANLSSSDIDMLAKFHKTRFSEEQAVETAFQLRYKTLILNELNLQAENPTEAFIAALLENAMSEYRVQGLYEKLKPIVKSSLTELISKEPSAEKSDEETGAGVQRRHRSPRTANARPRFRFDEVDIPTGAELVCTLDDTVRPVVASDSNKVCWNGEVTTLSAITSAVKGGGSWQGTMFFKYEGETIDSRRRRLAATKQ